MRVLLVYSSQAEYLLPAPPIGMSYVASAARAAGHRVRFLDLLHSQKPEDDLRAAVGEFEPDVVGISVRHIDNLACQRSQWHLDEVRARIALIRQTSRARIVLGGPAITVLGTSALAHLDADFAVLGEGEVAFPALLSAIENGRGCADIPGVCFRDGDRIHGTPTSHLAGFGSSHMEDWVDWSGYERRGGTWAIQTKRGCPLQCIYCPLPALEGRITRRRPVEEVVDELERVHRTQRPRTFDIVDASFNVPLEPALELCEAIIRRGLKINLTVGSVNALTACEELFSLMTRAGFRSMIITAEAANDAMLRNYQKGFTMDHVHRAVRFARGSGISTGWFFLLGGPGESHETVEATVSFAEQTLTWEHCLTIISTGVRILPGTELALWAAEEGHRKSNEDLAKPIFYLSPAVTEAWIIERINRAIAVNPCIVHAAEGGDSPGRRAFHRVLHLAGVAPPYWRVLPRLLRLRPMHRFRIAHPLVANTAARERSDADMVVK